MGNTEHNKQENTPKNPSLLKMIAEWFFNHNSFRRSIAHYKYFWFIWEILLASALGLILLYPVLDWQYSRILFIALIVAILWTPLKVVCEQLKIGKTILCERLTIGRIVFCVLIVTMLVLLAYKLIPLSQPSWVFNHWWCRIMIIALTVLMLFRPLNAVYGLMGTSGSIRILFINFVVISLVFSTIYYFGFFKDAGISYGVNQPHINYQFYANNSQCNPPVREIRDTVLLEHTSDKLSFKETVVHVKKDTLHYQRIEFMRVWRSTIMTTLTQEPTDLFSIASVHNVSMESENVGLDKEKSDIFEWILIFHIIISWIFFGVFISLLYNKFRYES